MKKLLLTALVPLLTLSTGCFPFMFSDDDDDPPQVVDTPPPPPPAFENLPPSVIIDGTGWPPSGPDSVITFRMTDDVGLSSLRADFVHSVELSPFGTMDTLGIDAAQLGEGFGTLEVTVRDSEGLETVASVEEFLIDLSDPEITLGDTILRRADDSKIELWGADAFVLGHMEIEIGEVALTHDFSDVFPSTLGEAWHYGAVSFDTTTFEEGTHEATARLYDAAGNVVEAEFSITLDGTAPSMAISSPGPDATVTGVVDVVMQAADERGLPVAIELRADGVPVATATGPEATVQLDTATLTPGVVELTAIGTDDVGNDSVVASVSITVQ